MSNSAAERLSLPRLSKAALIQIITLMVIGCGGDGNTSTSDSPDAGGMGNTVLTPDESFAVSQRGHINRLVSHCKDAQAGTAQDNNGSVTHTLTTPDGTRIECTVHDPSGFAAQSPDPQGWIVVRVTSPDGSMQDWELGLNLPGSSDGQRVCIIWPDNLGIETRHPPEGHTDKKLHTDRVCDHRARPFGWKTMEDSAAGATILDAARTAVSELGSE